VTRTLRYVSIVGGAIAGILLFLLASASENTDFLDRYYPWLLGLNILAGLALLTLVILMLYRLYNRYKRGKFGSKLMTRLVILFALVGILPGAVIYAVSIQFVSRSIESWFDLSVESALDAGVKLGRIILESSQTELNALADISAEELSVLSTAKHATFLKRLAQKKEGLEASLINHEGKVIYTSGSPSNNIHVALPTPGMLQQARVRGRYSAIEEELPAPGQSASGRTGIHLRVIVALKNLPAKASAKAHPSGEIYFLHFLQKVPHALASNADALSDAYSEYQVRSLSRSGLKKIYVVTLSLTLLLAVFSAIAASFLIASHLAKPLLLLAEGTKAVAEGNLSPRPIVSTTDELGTLTQSFNTMTRQLAEAKALAEQNRNDLEAAKVHLESVLANMSAGVIVLDHQFRLVNCNDAVARILHQNLEPHRNRAISEIENLESFSTALIKMFSDQSVHAAASSDTELLPYWQQQIEIPRHTDNAGEGEPLMLLARGSRLHVQGQDGYIIVFDDITKVISAQRSLAWSEVAKRLAHEIKNPLTPIQLSAERLQRRLEEKLNEPDATMLRKSTETIVNQVASMKQMVNDFRNYAQTPTAHLTPLDLNKLVEELVHLYSGNEAHRIIYASLTPGLPRVMGDAIQLRQVIHNLLQNAQDAIYEHKSNDGSWAPRIDINTEKVSYQDTSDNTCIAVRLSVVDNGPGFAQKILARIFEPYNTTKEKGTGLGMALVKKIVEEHKGLIEAQNRIDGNGAKVSILLLQLEEPVQ